MVGSAVGGLLGHQRQLSLGRFPLITSANQLEEETPQNDLRGFAEEVVFVVEDCATQRAEIAEAIAIEGYRAVPCGSASELQKIVQDYSTGCILLDIQLPGLDGTALQDWIADVGPVIPIIFMTGVTDVTTAVNCMKLGAFDYLRKPIKMPELLASVLAAVRLSRKLTFLKQSGDHARALLATLTPTERKLAEFIAAGATTKAAAAALGRSENTIKIHRRRVFEKLATVSAAGVANIVRYSRTWPSTNARDTLDPFQRGGSGPIAL
jgi:FixJ family two-component response regulator